MSFYKISLYLFLAFLFSGCLLTHKEIQQKSRTAPEEVDEEDMSAPLDTKAKEEAPPTSPKKARPSNITEQMAQMSESLRELRGDITNANKEQADRLQQVEQGLISLIQALDLRVTSLAQELEKIRKGPAKKTTTEEAFHKAQQLFKEEKWKSAIIQYEEYRAKNKKGKFYKQSTLQIGLCFQKLGMQKEAKVFFREVVESFPKSTESKTAHKLLSGPAPTSSAPTSSAPTKKPVQPTKP